MSNVQFEDFTIEVTAAIDDRISAALEEAAGELESQVKQNSRVASGKTRNSFKHKVVDADHIAYIGSDAENAIWEEFGTGEHALQGNGRKGWPGKKPSRAFWKAYVEQKNKLIRIIEHALKRL